MITITPHFAIGQIVSFRDRVDVVREIEIHVSNKGHVDETYWLEEAGDVHSSHLETAEAPPPDRDTFVTNDNGMIYLDNFLVCGVGDANVDENMRQVMAIFLNVVGGRETPGMTLDRLFANFKRVLDGRLIPKGKIVPESWKTTEFMDAAKALYYHIMNCPEIEKKRFEDMYETLCAR